MNWLDFVAVSEWPALVASGLALFRRQIGTLLSKLGSGSQISIPQLPKAAPLIEAAEEIASERLVREEPFAPTRNAEGGPWQAAVDVEIELLTESDEYPSEYCLLRSWGALERTARSKAALLAQTDEKKRLTMAELAEALTLDDGEKTLGGRLRDIRNKVADGELSVSPTDALRYRDLVIALLRALRNRDSSRSSRVTGEVAIRS